MFYAYLLVYLSDNKYYVRASTRAGVSAANADGYRQGGRWTWKVPEGGPGNVSHLRVLPTSTGADCMYYIGN